MKKVAGIITRKSLIYKTDVEYGDYTLNHVFGCAHGCRYPCYAFLMAKRFGKIKSYEEWLKPYIVGNSLELLDNEIPKYKNKVKMLHLCFTSDPFMFGYQDIRDLSLAIIQKCNKNQINCSVLTKGILPIELSNLSHHNEYGITLVSLDEDFRSSMEPNTASIKERIDSLKALHDLGCKTWVSIEPYPTPNIIDQNIMDVLSRISFVDKIIFGRMNYNPQVTKFPAYKEYYNSLAITVTSFCIQNNIHCHIKTGTKKQE